MTPNPHANPIPNILTGLRLFAGVIMFLILAGAAPQGIPMLSEYLSPDDQFMLGRNAFIIFVIAASTDWVDGFLARRWHATTRWGAILDPIADKVLVTGAILGVLAWGSVPQAAIPCGLILFREFAVSALRETVAGKVKLPVTLLAKWKTTLQMVAGFEAVSSGRIELDGRDITHAKANTRGLGIVFQSYALFPHMTVAKNVAFGLEMRGVEKNELERRVKEAIAMVRLEPDSRLTAVVAHAPRLGQQVDEEQAAPARLAVEGAARPGLERCTGVGDLDPDVALGDRARDRHDRCV